MEKLKSLRKIDELGRIVLPAEVREIMAWYKGRVLGIWVNEKVDEVILKAHTYACTYCGALENLKEFNKRFVCSECQGEISKL